jgi:hypothetical protein
MPKKKGQHRSKNNNDMMPDADVHKQNCITKAKLLGIINANF